MFNVGAAGRHICTWKLSRCCSSVRPQVLLASNFDQQQSRILKSRQVDLLTKIMTKV